MTLKKLVIAIVFGIGALLGLWLSIVVMLIGGLLQFVDTLFNPTIALREILILFSLMRMILGPFLGLIIFALTMNVIDIIGKEE